MQESQIEGWALMTVPATPGEAVRGVHEAKDLTRIIKAQLRHHSPERSRTFEQLRRECGQQGDVLGEQFSLDIARALTLLVAQGKVVQTDMPGLDSSHTVKNYMAAPGTYVHHDRQEVCNPRDLSKSISSWLKYKNSGVHNTSLAEAHAYACTRGFHVTQETVKNILLGDRKHWIVHTNQHGDVMVQVTRMRDGTGNRVYLPAEL